MARDYDPAKRRAKMQRTMSAEREQMKAEIASIRNRLSQEIRKARRAGDQERLQELRIKQSEMVAKYRRKSSSNSFYRASELTSPARPGHFLREFGQSDREAIDNSNADPAVTQVLSLMNGVIQGQIANSQNTVLMRNVMKSDMGQKIDAVYLTMLNRYPSQSEKRDWVNEFEAHPNKSEVIPDLIWVLANSNEFIFIK